MDLLNWLNYKEVLRCFESILVWESHRAIENFGTYSVYVYALL